MYAPHPLLLPVLAQPDGQLERVLEPGHLAVHLIEVSTGKRLTLDRLDTLKISPLAAFVGARRARQLTLHSVRISHHPEVPAIRLVSDTHGDAASHLLCLRDIIQPFPANGALIMVPARDQLMVLPLADISCMGWMDVLVHAGRTAHDNSIQPISGDLYWADGSQTRRFLPNLDREGITLDPPAGFRAMVQRLAQRALRRVDAVA